MSEIGRTKRCYNPYEARMYLGVDAEFFAKEIVPNLTWIPAGVTDVCEVVDLDAAWDAYVARLEEPPPAGTKAKERRAA